MFVYFSWYFKAVSVHKLGVEDVKVGTGLLQVRHLRDEVLHDRVVHLERCGDKVLGRFGVFGRRAQFVDIHGGHVVHKGIRGRKVSEAHGQRVPVGQGVFVLDAADGGTRDGRRLHDLGVKGERPAPRARLLDPCTVARRHVVPGIVLRRDAQRGRVKRLFLRRDTVGAVAGEGGGFDEDSRLPSMRGVL